MIDRIRDQYEHLYHMPFPNLGKVVGDFPMYEMLLTGVANSYIAGRTLALDDLPAPDDGTFEAVLELRQKQSLTDEEQSFLEYFEVLETLQALLEQALQSGNSAS
jgi:hypothetical protein